MNRSAGAGILLCVVVASIALFPPSAAADEDCRRAVVFALPGVTWQDIEDLRPREFLAAVADGASGSMSVRTNTSRTSPASGFGSVGAGARVDGGRIAGGVIDSVEQRGRLAIGVRASGLEEMRERAGMVGYGAVPGALGAAFGDLTLAAIGSSDLGKPAPSPVGHARWAVLGAMDPDGVVDVAAVDEDLLRPAENWPFGVRTDRTAFAEALDELWDYDACASAIVDPGDPARAERLANITLDPLPQQRSQALRAADELLGLVRARLDPARDLLLIVSPTSPEWAPEAHLGVAVAVGPGFDAGRSLSSPSTRRNGIVTLPDVAPTVIAHVGLDLPGAMSGRAFFAVPHPGDRVAAAVDLDDETVFVDSLKTAVTTAFVLAQLAVFLLTVGLIAWRERSGTVAGSGLGRALEIGGLAVVAFPISTFLGGFVSAQELGAAAYLGIVLALSAALVATAIVATKGSLDRLLVLAAFTFGVLCLDLVTGGRLQINTIFGYSPIVAGRFAGAGNTAFTILGVSAVLTAALIVHRARGSRTSLAYAAAIFVAAVVIDGAPQFGSDVGGIVALVPAYVITWMLLSGLRPNPRLIVIALLGTAVTLAAFLAWDLAGPPESQTHLARLFEDFVDRPSSLWDTIVRKAGANLRIFRTSIYTYLVPPALGVMAYLLLRPRGRWRLIETMFPKPRAGLVGGLLVAVFGFVVNDSGIAIPAVALSFLVPMALLLHLAIEEKRLAEIRGVG